MVRSALYNAAIAELITDGMVASSGLVLLQTLSMRKERMVEVSQGSPRYRGGVCVWGGGDVDGAHAQLFGAVLVWALQLLWQAWLPKDAWWSQASCGAGHLLVSLACHNSGSHQQPMRSSRSMPVLVLHIAGKSGCVNCLMKQL